jgi:HEAT repeat protein
MRAPLLTFVLFGVSLAAAQAAPDAPTFAGKPLAHWIDLLKSDSPLLREEAMAVLGEMGLQAREALPALRPFLKSDDARLRLRAAITVWKIERQEKDVLPVFTDCLRDTNPERRALALATLEQMGTAAAPAAPALVELLDDGDAQVRGRAANALRQMGASASGPLVAGLKDREAEGRYQCVALLRPYVAANPKTADALAERLKDDDKTVRLEAARALLLSTPHRPAVLATFKEAVKDPDVLYRRAVVASAFTVSPRPRELLELFGTLLEDPDLQVAGSAAQAVWEATKDAERVTPTLLRLLKDQDPFKHAVALQTLRQMGPAALPCLPALLHGPTGDFTSLGEVVRQIGPAALPDLLAAADVKTTGAVRRKAVTVLGHAGPDAVPHLLRLLDDVNPGVREAAVSSLGAVGPKAKEALPALEKIVKEEKGYIRTLALFSLGKLGAEAKPALPLLLESVRGKDAELRFPALVALEQVPGDAKDVVPALDEAIKADVPPAFRLKAARLRLKLDPDPDPVLPVLGELLKEILTQQEVIAVLGELGPKAAPALPQLMEIAQAKTPPVFSNLTLLSALVRIDPEGKTVTPALLTFLRDRDRLVRLGALSHLARLGQECDVTPLLAELRGNDAFAQAQLHRALRQLGPKAKGATATLVELVRGADAAARIEAAETLCRVAPDQAELGKGVLLDNLAEGKPGRYQAARGLLDVDPKDERALKLFEAVLTGADPAQRASALVALGQADPSAKGVLPHLEPLLQDKDLGIRILACRAHWKVTGEAKAAVTALGAVLEDKGSAPWHGNAVGLLGEIGPDAKAAVPLLTGLLKEKQPRLRVDVMAALARIDPEAARRAQEP